MCTGGRLLADFRVGTDTQPGGLPDSVAATLTLTVDGLWVAWAHKVAFVVGNEFRALNGSSYPADATASCNCGQRHEAPDRACTCGFHALSNPQDWLLKRASRFDDAALLSVALSGRVLAFEWPGSGVLFRAERQTVIRVVRRDGRQVPRQLPGDSSGHPAITNGSPSSGSGAAQLRLPRATPPTVALNDDAGWCLGELVSPHSHERTPVLV